jgi:hypothetical protein
MPTIHFWVLWLFVMMIRANYKQTIPLCRSLPSHHCNAILFIRWCCFVFVVETKKRGIFLGGFKARKQTPPQKA